MDRLAREPVDAEETLAGAPDLARSIVEELRAEYGPVEVNAEREWYAPEHHDSDASAPDGLYRYASVWRRRRPRRRRPPRGPERRLLAGCDLSRGAGRQRSAAGAGGDRRRGLVLRDTRP